MKANGNGTPETCASNLLRTVRGEVPFDRVRGVDPAYIDQPNASEDALADAEWVLETYEPRVEVETSEIDQEAAATGGFSALLNIKRKEDEEEWPT